MPSTFGAMIRQTSIQRAYKAEITLGRISGGSVVTKVLSFSSAPLPAARQIEDGKWSDDRIDPLPSISILCQTPMAYGRAQRSYGSMGLIGVDGRFSDLFPPNWYWAGRPIRIWFGALDLPMSQWRVIFDGYTGKVSFDDNRITLSLVDKFALAWETIRTPGDYSGTIPDLVSACLTQAGITSISAAAWNYWAAQNNFQAWYRATGEQSIGTIIDNLVTPLASSFYTDTNDVGAFRIFPMTAPGTEPDPYNVDLDDWEVLNYCPGEMVWPRLKSLSVKYLTATGDSPTYGTVSTSDANIAALDKTSRDEVFTTALTSATDAATVRDRWWALLASPRTAITVKTWTKAYMYGPGNTFRLLNHTQHGLSGVWRIAGVTSEASDGSVSFEGWR